MILRPNILPKTQLMSVDIKSTLSSISASNNATANHQIPIADTLLFSLHLYRRSLLLRFVLLGLMRVFDRQTPDVQIVTNSPNDVDNKASMHANGKT